LSLSIYGLTIRTAPPFPLFFTSVRIRTLSAPYFLLYRDATWQEILKKEKSDKQISVGITLNCLAQQKGVERKRNSFVTQSPSPPKKKLENDHLCGFVVAAIVNHDDLIGERGLLFLQ